MKTIKFKAGEVVKLSVIISSDANVGSNVSLNDAVVKKSILNKFDVDLGAIDAIDGKTLSVVSNFFFNSGAIDAVMASSHVDCTLSSVSNSEIISAEKVKVNANLFMAYIVVKLKKE